MARLAHVGGYRCSDVRGLDGAAAGGSLGQGWLARSSERHVGGLGGALWRSLRVIGYVLVTPLVEELAFRGYVARRLIAVGRRHGSTRNVQLAIVSRLILPSLWGISRPALAARHDRRPGLCLRALPPPVARRCGPGLCDHEWADRVLRVRHRSVVGVVVGVKEMGDMRRIVYGVGFRTVLASVSNAVMAGTGGSVPEISGGSLSTGLGLARRRHSHAAGALREEIVRDRSLSARRVHETDCLRFRVSDGVLASLSTAVMAGGVGVPEISGGSLSMGLGLLAGGILLLRARFGEEIVRDRSLSAG